MVAELLGAKMLAPHFGSSLHVWSTVLAITLGGLALGYFFGGLLSEKKRSPKVLLVVLLIGSAFIILMPFLSKTFIYIFGSMSITPAIIICTFAFLFPPVFMMGMVSPLLVGLMSEDKAHPGRVAGTIYAVSTVGGIIATFLLGFVIIPAFGLTMPAIFTGALLGIIPLILLFKKHWGAALIWLGILAWGTDRYYSPELVPGIPVPYKSEGLMGQIMVVDYPLSDSTGKFNGFNRTLFVNRMTQAQLSPVEGEQYFAYIPFLNNLLKHYSFGSRFLVCGMGGGGLANELIKSGYEVDVCEIDPRIAYVAEEYFELSPRVNVFIDDARHYIRTCGRMYDGIVLDVFKGEEIPSHCFTLEAFAEIKSILRENGALIINGNGYFEGDKGKGTRSIAKTLYASGFDINLFPTADEEDWSNIEFYCTRETEIRKFDPGYIKEIPTTEKLLEKEILLTDDRPILDVLNKDAYTAWRRLSISYFLSEMKRQRYYPLFQ